MIEASINFHWLIRAHYNEEIILVELINFGSYRWTFIHNLLTAKRVDEKLNDDGETEDESDNFFENTLDHHELKANDTEEERADEKLSENDRFNEIIEITG